MQFYLFDGLLIWLCTVLVLILQPIFFFDSFQWKGMDEKAHFISTLADQYNFLYKNNC